MNYTSIKLLLKQTNKKNSWWPVGGDRPGSPTSCFQGSRHAALPWPSWLPARLLHRQAPALHQTRGPGLSLPPPLCHMLGNKESSFMNFPPTLAPSPNAISPLFWQISPESERGHKQPLPCPSLFLGRGWSPPKERQGHQWSPCIPG